MIKRKKFFVIFFITLCVGVGGILVNAIQQGAREKNLKNAGEYKVVILGYHGLIKDSQVDERKFKLGYEGAPYLYIRKESQFINDMAYIKKGGYEVISLYDLLEIKNKQRHLNTDAIVITFDDGSKSQYDIALPILKEYDYKATFFIITNTIGRGGAVTWEELKEMASHKSKDGEYLFNIESHTHTHPSLINKEIAETEEQYKKRIRSELSISQSIIQQELSKTPRFLALPYGSGSRPGEEQAFVLIKNLAKECGYYGIRTSNPGNVNVFFDDLYKLNAVPILNKTSIKNIKGHIKGSANSRIGNIKAHIPQNIKVFLYKIYSRIPITF